MARKMGIRGQLLLGLATIVVMVVVSVSIITLWASRQRAVEGELLSRRRLARAAAMVLAPFMERGAVSRPQGEVGARLERALGYIERLARKTRVYDRRGRPLAGDPIVVSRGHVRHALDIAEQQTELHEEGVLVLTPIFGMRGQVAGVLAQRFAKVGDSASLPGIYYVAMVLDGLVLLAFVFIMITRTVAGPLREIEGAAAAVARGDLAHRLEVRGPRELASLSSSFNTMTEALAEQLRELERQRQSLIRSEKLASVGRLAAGVAHEIGNPLQAVIGFVDILIQSPPRPDVQAELLQRIQTEAERIHQIVRQLLDYSRPREEEARAVVVGGVVEEALALVLPQKRFKGVKVVRDPSLGSLPLVAVDARRFVQVLVNLLLNAADALDPGGEVYLEGREEGEGVLLAVENDGIPIPEAHRAKIFDPFFSTKEPGEGTGLGLAVSLSIIESFGGSLQLAESERTRFEVVLPLWEDESEGERDESEGERDDEEDEHEDGRGASRTTAEAPS